VSDTWQVYAIRYAHHPDRTASENFIGGDPHQGAMPLDFFVWAIVGEKRSFVVDTGFDEATGRRRKRQFLRSPAEGLKLVGVDPAQVEDVVITHMHYDHAGNHDMFPRATYHLQDREMQYCTGRCMCHPAMRMAFDRDDVAAMVTRLFEGRVRFHDGSEELADGISVHHIGGHTMGLQSVRVRTRRGWVVLASDASHLYANMDQGRPFPIVHNLADMLEGYGKLRRLASSPDHVVPGHDPLVLRRYPAAKPGLEGIAVRLDVEPAERAQ
jgi:glyoxylase-like metal-dependent hydrolase (beta-lactamase superfamily II)